MTSIGSYTHGCHRGMDVMGMSAMGETDCFLLNLTSALQEGSHARGCKSDQEYTVQELGVPAMNLLLLLCLMNIVSERSFFLQWMMVVNVVITVKVQRLSVCTVLNQRTYIYITTPLSRLRDPQKQKEERSLGSGRTKVKQCPLWTRHDPVLMTLR